MAKVLVAFFSNTAVLEIHLRGQSMLKNTSKKKKKKRFIFNRVTINQFLLKKKTKQNKTKKQNLVAFRLLEQLLAANQSYLDLLSQSNSFIGVL